MANPTVYGPKFSTFTRSVLLSLEEKGIAHDIEEVNIFEGTHQSAEHLARHPFGKVPGFTHDGFSVYETSAIIRYVDEAFDGPSLQPTDAKARARMHQIIAVVDSYAYPAFITGIVIPRIVAPMLGGETDMSVVEAAMPMAKTSVAALDSLLGDDLSLADLHMVPVVDYFSQTPEGADLMADAPNLTAWWDGIKARPSVVKTTPQLGQ